MVHKKEMKIHTHYRKNDVNVIVKHATYQKKKVIVKHADIHDKQIIDIICLRIYIARNIDM